MIERRWWELAAGSLCIATYLTIAQAQGPGGRGGRFEGMRGPSPLMLALDADGDGELSPKEIENATATLKTLDKDKNGTLSRQELAPAALPPGRRGMAPGNDAVAAVSALMTYDKNGDGKLSKDELPERLRPLMDRADSNKDGFLDRAELTEYARRQGRGNPGARDEDEPRRNGEGRRKDQPSI